MNRVNKYRGQRCNDGQWVYGYYVESNRSWDGHKPHKSWIVTSVMSNGGFFNVMGRYAVKDDTVGQFIGLTDKNGKEIYEGDIIQLRQPDGNCVLCEVSFCEKGYWAISFGINERIILGYINSDQIEAIGNIHDNPELIKE